MEIEPSLDIGFVEMQRVIRKVMLHILTTGSRYFLRYCGVCVCLFYWVATVCVVGVGVGWRGWWWRCMATEPSFISTPPSSPYPQDQGSGVGGQSAPCIRADTPRFTKPLQRLHTSVCAYVSGAAWTASPFWYGEVAWYSQVRSVKSKWRVSFIFCFWCPVGCVVR